MQSEVSLACKEALEIASVFKSTTHKEIWEDAFQNIFLCAHSLNNEFIDNLLSKRKNISLIEAKLLSSLNKHEANEIKIELKEAKKDRFLYIMKCMWNEINSIHRKNQNNFLAKNLDVSFQEKTHPIANENRNNCKLSKKEEKHLKDLKSETRLRINLLDYRYKEAFRHISATDIVKNLAIQEFYDKELTSEERDLVKSALEVGFNREARAELLGISKDCLSQRQDRMRKRLAEQGIAELFSDRDMGDLTSTINYYHTEDMLEAA